MEFPPDAALFEPNRKISIDRMKSGDLASAPVRATRRPSRAWIAPRQQRGDPVA
jgi:hypothetical protein